MPLNEFRHTFPTNDAIFGVELSGSQLLDILEQSVTVSTTGSYGSFPCGAGIRYNVNMNAIEGNRLSNVQVSVVGNNDREWIQLQSNEMYLVATTKTLLQGGIPGYNTWSMIEDVIDFHQSFDELFSSCASLNCPFGEIASDEYSTQEYTSR